MGPKKSRGQVEHLKRCWLADPCFDLYAEEGFEEYRKELTDFQRKQELLWKAEEEGRRRERARKMGIPDNLELADYIRLLEHRITQLEQKVGI